jgi:hypothetical protein
MAKIGSISKGRKKRLNDISFFISKNEWKIDYYDIADMFKISPAQSRIDLTHLIRSKRVSISKLYAFEDGKNFMDQPIVRYHKRKE